VRLVKELQVVGRETPSIRLFFEVLHAFLDLSALGIRLLLVLPMLWEL